VRALTVFPGKPGLAELVEVPEQDPTEGSVLVETIAVGVDGTDNEIVEGQYGEAPPGKDRLILGHESLGRVIDAPPGGAFARGDHLVAFVRRPDPVPCRQCAAGEWDMCSNGMYLEHGIKGADGFIAERFRVEADAAIRADPALGQLAVLTEPTSVVAKAWDHVERIGSRLSWAPERALVTGAGPLGLLATMLAVQRGLETHVLDVTTEGPKPDLARRVGASYHTGSLDDFDRPFDVVIECTGVGLLVLHAVEHLAPNGVMCLTGISGAGRTGAMFDTDMLNKAIVLEQQRGVRVGERRTASLRGRRPGAGEGGSRVAGRPDHAAGAARSMAGGAGAPGRRREDDHRVRDVPVSDRPIADYALLSDCRSAALVSSEGSIDWLCFPRFDRPSVFARLLDHDAGHWSIRPVGGFETSRRYVSGTMVLETTFRTPDGSAVLVDAMAIGSAGSGHMLGADAPGLLVRRVTGTEGAVEFEMEYAPRPEYGLIFPFLTVEEGFVHGRGGADVLMLSGTRTPHVEEATARSSFRVEAGERRSFSLHHRSSWDPASTALTEEACHGWMDGTIEAWQRWSDLHRDYDGPWRDLVLLSGRVLQALTYKPTGAIVAAPTTSLPETPGGDRNWDYRFAWVRDASFTLEALSVAACPDEAHQFFEWMAGATAARVHLGSELQIMFGVGGEHDLSERELKHLRGWRGSVPVRLGNGAWDQRQLDVYGELLGAADRLADVGGEFHPTTKHFLADVADAAAARWQETDEGIWEVRGGRREFLYSKLMCWAALDRAIAMADRLEARERVDDWTKVREDIREAILSRGWSDEAGAFTQSFDSDELDASVLMMPIVGFLPGTDPRILSTIEAIETRLTDDRGLVYRYRAEDGLEGEEGTFLLCTFWLAQAQAIAGLVEPARATFERAIASLNDVGLLAEEVDPATGELLGNFPQAFSHIGLINAASAIAEAERTGVAAPLMG